MARQLHFVYGFLLLSLVAATAPSITELGTVSILAPGNLDPNDIDGTSAALLLSSPGTLSQAEESCKALGESLWSSAGAPFTSGLDKSLAYEVYSGRVSESQIFWVQQKSKGNGKGCQAMGVAGDIQRISCNQKLPALCSHSAPASTSTYADTSARFRLAQDVGSQTLIGYRDHFTFRYMGVRFANEPARFTYSKLLKADGTHDALEPAPECLQLPYNGSSTDCLFLNVWTTAIPAKKDQAQKDLKPVMIYIYGGGFTTGSASNPNQDGSYLASRGDVVVVAIAYRLSTLGFLPFEDGVHNGNYYISDQINGLKWVQENIQYFGGDPSHVTIFGESAGAASVQKLLESPEASGLFHAAIAQSDYNEPNLSIKTEYNETTVPILEETGCDKAKNQLACLRAYDAVDLISLSTISNTPVIDGKYLRSSFLDFDNKPPGLKPNSVPFMIGVNRDEGGVLGPYIETTKLNTGIKELAQSEGLNAKAIISSGDFPLGDGPVPSNMTLDVFNTTTRIYTDNSFRCTSQAIAYGGVKSGRIPDVWFYEFNRSYQDPGYDMWHVCQPPVTATHPYGDPSEEYFKCHAGDLYFTFGTVLRSGLHYRDQDDEPYQRLIVDYWTSFGRTFNPNPDLDYLRVRGYTDTISQVGIAGEWPKVDARDPKLMQLQWNGFVHSFVDDAQCKVLDLGLNYLLK